MAVSSSSGGVGFSDRVDQFGDEYDTVEFIENILQEARKVAEEEGRVLTRITSPAGKLADSFTYSNPEDSDENCEYISVTELALSVFTRMSVLEEPVYDETINFHLHCFGQKQEVKNGKVLDKPMSQEARKALVAKFVSRREAFGLANQATHLAPLDLSDLDLRCQRLNLWMMKDATVFNTSFEKATLDFSCHPYWKKGHDTLGNAQFNNCNFDGATIIGIDLSRICANSSFEGTKFVDCWQSKDWKLLGARSLGGEGRGVSASSSQTGDAPSRRGQDVGASLRGQIGPSREGGKSSGGASSSSVQEQRQKEVSLRLNNYLEECRQDRNDPLRGAFSTGR